MLFTSPALVVALALNVLLTSARGIRRQSATYPAPGTIAPAPLQAWIDALDTAKVAGLIPDDAPAVQAAGGIPIYAAGVATGTDGVCSWSTSHCFAADDIYEAGDGIWALSLDDGPTRSSPRLYDFLQANNQPATHFLIGTNILALPDLFAQAVASGGHIASHTWSHPYMTTLSDLKVVGELGWTSQIIYDLSGLLPAFWRPPYGDVDRRVRAIAREVFGLQTVIWTQNSNDLCLPIEDPSLPAPLPSTCAPGNPTTQEELELEIQEFQQRPKSPGVLLLQHETRAGTVGGFINTFPGISGNGWAPRIIPELGPNPQRWYQNAARNGGARTPSTGVIRFLNSSSYGTSVAEPEPSQLATTSAAEPSDVATESTTEDDAPIVLHEQPTGAAISRFDSGEARSVSVPTTIVVAVALLCVKLWY